MRPPTSPSTSWSTTASASPRSDRRTAPRPLGQGQALIGAYARSYTGLRFGADDAEGAETARGKIVAAIDRLDAELAASRESTSSASASASPTSPPPRSSIRWSTPERDRLPPTCRRRRGFERFREAISERAAATSG